MLQTTTFSSSLPIQIVGNSTKEHGPILLISAARRSGGGGGQREEAQGGALRRFHVRDGGGPRKCMRRPAFPPPRAPPHVKALDLDATVKAVMRPVGEMKGGNVNIKVVVVSGNSNTTMNF